MNTSEKVKMTVTMDVTIPQAITLKNMFEYYNALSSRGSSRNVSFYADGDGNFHPKCEISFNEETSKIIKEVTEELSKHSDKENYNFGIVEDKNGNRKYDFDSVAWALDEIIHSR